MVIRKKIILSLLFWSACYGVYADDSTNSVSQLQQLNSSSIQSEDILWARMRDGFKLNHQETKEVKYWEKRYGSPKYFNIIMQNAAPYLYFVVTEMQRRGVPTELALIPIVESTYNPNAVSPAAISTGMWQFIGSSGTRFGLVQNSDIDERKDIIKSTRAAITYFIYLHDMFGSWELAIAAYNWGEGNINNALKNSSSTNFYDLDVRDITHQYVPKVIALANIIQNPSKFGIKLTNLKNQPYFAAINPAMPTTVNQFMTMANMSTLDNKKLNPQYNSLDYLVKQNQKLLLPVTSQSAYFASIGGVPTLAQNNSPAIQASAPIVSAVNNESPAVATAQYNNNASAATAIVAAVAVPIINDGINQLAAGSNNANTSATTPKTPAVIISNQPNANTNIALSKSAITDLLGGGSVIAAGAATKPVKNSTSEINYTVTQGDTLYSIAKKFAVPIASIIQDNQILDNTVKLNQTLVIRNPNNS